HVRSSSPRWVFGPFRLDLEHACLWCEGHSTGLLRFPPASRIVKIFELAFPREATPRPSPALGLVFCSTLTHTPCQYRRQRLRGEAMDWKHLLAYITGTVDQELLVRNEYLVTENRILRAQLKGRVRLRDGERKTLAEIGQKLGKQALQ